MEVGNKAAEASSDSYSGKISGHLSVLRLSDSDIMREIRRKHTVAKVLLALNEEPMYISELVGRLNLSKPTVNSAVSFLFNLQLIKELDALDEPEEIKSIITRKMRDVGLKLPKNIGVATLRRMKFYQISRRGEKFVKFAEEIYKDKIWALSR